MECRSSSSVSGTAARCSGYGGYLSTSHHLHCNHCVDTRYYRGVWGQKTRCWLQMVTALPTPGPGRGVTHNQQLPPASRYNNNAGHLILKVISMNEVNSHLHCNFTPCRPTLRHGISWSAVAAPVQASLGILQPLSSNVQPRTG